MVVRGSEGAGLRELWSSASRAVLPMMTTKSKVAYGGLGRTVAVRTPMMSIKPLTHPCTVVYHPSHHSGPSPP